MSATGASAIPVAEPAAGQDVALIVILLLIMLFFLVRNMASFKGLKIRAPGDKPSESETDGGTTTDAGDEDEEEEEEEEEDKKGQ